jgi:hypothetical protein
MFSCDKCGICCCNLKNSDIYGDLDRGDGICMYYDEVTKLCEIYAQRPVKCRIDDMYYKYYKEVMSIDEYYKINYDACKILKENEAK